MTDNPTEQHVVSVVRNGVPATWPLHVAEGTYPELVLRLIGPDQTWTATGLSVFAALMGLREQLDMEEIRVCCNGARRNAWSSGMQQDMGRGRFVYLLEENQSGRPTEVHTLDAAPCDQIATVQEQKEWYAGWLAQRTGQRD